MTPEPQRRNEPDRKEQEEFKLPANQDRAANFSIAGLDPASFAFRQTIAAAVRALNEGSGACVPLATSDALYSLRVARIRCRSEHTDPADRVRPALYRSGELLARELEALDTTSGAMLVGCWQVLKERTAAGYRSMNLLTDWSAKLRDIDHAGDPLGPRCIRKLYYALQGLPHGASVQYVSELLNDVMTRLECNVKLIDALSPAAATTGTAAMEWLRSGSGGRYTEPPVGPEYYDRRSMVYNDARRIFKRALAHSGSFSRWSGDSMSVPTAKGRDLPLLARFGQGSFEHCLAVHSTDPNSPPGRGFFLKGAHMSRLFFTGTFSNEFLPEREGKYRDAYRRLGRAFDEFADASFILLRGAIIVYHPGEHYTLPYGGISDRTHKYCLYIPNDHLDGAFEHGFLVPIDRIAKALQGARYPLGGKPGPSTGDLAASEISGLRLSGAQDQPYVISLSNLSTVFGSLVMGLPIRSAPLFDWEAQQSQSILWKDKLMHYHFGWLQVQNNCYSEKADPDEEARRIVVRDRLLAPYEEASYKIHDCAAGLFNLLDLFCNRFAAYKNDLVPNPPEFPRMAQELYRFNAALSYGLPSGDVPQLVLTRTVDPGFKPIAVADPVKMVMRLPDGRIEQLPRSLDYWDSREMALWRQAIRLQTVELIDGIRHEKGGFELAFMKTSYIPEENRL